jgi:O-antigen/teichoic acid export membrane protein
VILICYIKRIGFCSLEEEGKNMKERLIRGMASTLMLKVVGMGLLFVANILLARGMGPAGYGIFEYALSWALALGTLAGLGIHQMVVREIGIYSEHDQISRLKGLLRWSNKTVSIGSLVVLSASFYITHVIISDRSIFLAVNLAILSIPLSALTELKQGIVRGFGCVSTWFIPMGFVRPFIFMLLLAGWSVTQYDLTPFISLYMFIFATLFALISAQLLVTKVTPEKLSPVSIQYCNKKWLKSATYFMSLGTIYIINSRADLIMVGSMLGMQEAGIYAGAVRFSLLLGFVLFAVNASLGPVISRLWAKGSRGELQFILTKSARISTLLVIPAAIICCFFGKWILALTLGEQFAAGSNVLLILSISQLINTAMGSVGLLMNMTGNEKSSAIAGAISVITNISLNMIFIPMFGMIGAAITTMTSVLLTNILLLFLSQSKLHFDTSIIGKVFFPTYKPK